jgi:hypothetical protein
MLHYVVCLSYITNLLETVPRHNYVLRLVTIKSQPAEHTGNHLKLSPINSETVNAKVHKRLVGRSPRK